jgi:hypothetical protein
MEESILLSTKKILGLEPDYVPFDLDIITHINTAFSILNQLGVGPVEGFSIIDETTQWGDYPVPLNQLQMVRTYIYLKVRVLFDPPGTSFLLESANNQIKEYEWRLNVFREDELVPHVEHFQRARVVNRTVIPSGRRWIDVNINPVTGEPLDGA